jgi:hypothetical protein
MKKIGMVCMALLLAMGGMGVGYAWWSEGMTINATMTTAGIPQPRADLVTVIQSNATKNETVSPNVFSFDTVNGYTLPLNIGFKAQNEGNNKSAVVTGTLTNSGEVAVTASAVLASSFGPVSCPVMLRGCAFDGTTRIEPGATVKFTLTFCWDQQKDALFGAQVRITLVPSE